MFSPYRSVSCSAKTFLLVWSRMTLMLTKHPKSSFFDRNIDILGDCEDGSAFGNPTKLDSRQVISRNQKISDRMQFVNALQTWHQQTIFITQISRD